MIKQSAWHYKLANFGSERVYPGTKVNFCNYFRYVVYGTLHLLAAMVVLGMFIESFYQFYMWCAYGTKMDDVAIAFVVVTICGLIGITGGYGVYKYLELTEDSRAEKRRLKRIEKQNREPGFFSMAYRKFKDKTCFMIKIEDDERV